MTASSLISIVIFKENICEKKKRNVNKRTPYVSNVPSSMIVPLTEPRTNLC